MKESMNVLLRSLHKLSLAGVARKTPPRSQLRMATLFKEEFLDVSCLIHSGPFSPVRISIGRVRISQQCGSPPYLLKTLSDACCAETR